MTPDPNSELARRADEIRGLAQSCKTINDLARVTGFSMETTRHWNKELGLNLSDAKLQAGPKAPAKAHPKPVKRK